MTRLIVDHSGNGWDLEYRDDVISGPEIAPGMRSITSESTFGTSKPFATGPEMWNDDYSVFCVLDIGAPNPSSLGGTFFQLNVNTPGLDSQIIASWFNADGEFLLQQWRIHGPAAGPDSHLFNNYPSSLSPITGLHTIAFTYSQIDGLGFVYLDGVPLNDGEPTGGPLVAPGEEFVNPTIGEIDGIVGTYPGVNAAHWAAFPSFLSDLDLQDLHAALVNDTAMRAAIMALTPALYYPLDDLAIPPLNISFPFFTGTAAGGGSAGGPYNIPVALAGHRYILEWSLYQRTTISPFREARDQSALPGENSLNPLAAWKRSRDDWSLGAGQTWADRSLDSASGTKNLEPRQFYKSKGLDPWTLGEIKLLPDTEIVPGLDSSSAMFKLITIGQWLYVLTDSELLRTSNPDAVSPMIDTITGLTGTYQTMATDGERVFISTSDGMWIHDISGTSAVAMSGAAATYNPSILQWTNGWLFGALGNVISEIRADGTVNTVFTHLNDGFFFTAIAGTPSMTYFGGQAVDINEIYRVGVKNDGTLAAAIFSGSLPLGELILSMAYYGGFVLIGSDKGVHLAAQAGDGTLNLAPVIQTTNGVNCMAAESRFVWFGWDNYDDVSSGLGRMDLSAFSDENKLISSWASDLMFANNGSIQAVARYQDKTYFAMDGNGVIRQHATNYVPEGTLEMGRFRWGTFEPKVWLGLEVVTDPLAGDTDGEIAMTITNESGVTTGLGTRGPSNSSTGVGAIYGVGTISKAYDWFGPIVILRPSGDLESTPIVRRVTLRALPVPKTIEQYTLPIIMSQQVNDGTGEGGEVAYDTSAEYRYLQQLVSQGAPVLLQIHGEQHFVTVREVGWDKVQGLTTDRKGVQGILVATLITAEI